ncbi:unnamed protein product [Ceratitis capitata]|uniref:(Mediterranean fruit fly) hypothetical protein n=1 Tax=Ceratitis capitata TaxID=7213 RepID=A0A811U3P0_CERCA|nr:unnamed protein product [Ceratitis capitata]
MNGPSANEEEEAFKAPIGKNLFQKFSNVTKTMTNNSGSEIIIHQSAIEELLTFRLFTQNTEIHLRKLMLLLRSRETKNNNKAQTFADQEVETSEIPTVCRGPRASRHSDIARLMDRPALVELPIMMAEQLVNALPPTAWTVLLAVRSAIY